MVVALVHHRTCRDEPSDRLDVPGEGGVDEGNTWECGGLRRVHQPLTVERADVLRVRRDPSRLVQLADAPQWLVVGVLVREVRRYVAIIVIKLL